MAPWLIVLLSVGPLIVVSAGVGAFLRFRPRVRPYAIATGTVVEPTDPDAFPAAFPDGGAGTIVEFVDRNGVSHQSSVAALRARPLGTELRIVYDTRDPRRASIDNFWTNGGSVFAVTGFTIVVAVAFVILVTMFP